VERLRFVNDLAVETGPKRVLDVGCGSGRFGIDLARRGAEVVGLDFAPDMVALANELAGRAGVADHCQFLCENFMTWEPAGAFDIGLAMGVTDYVADPTPLIERMASVVRGSVVVS